MLAFPSVLLRPCSSRFAASLTFPPMRGRNIHTTLSRREEKAAQPQTPATEHIELDAPVTYISESHDPWFNLSFEDWLLRNTPHNQPVLFLYRNYPCVVIGRNQNPWTETTPRKLREMSIPLVRRRSGGGTVYHDMGNTNFSVMLPRLLFTRSHGAQLVARAIRDRLGIQQCDVNDRNDVIIRDGEQELKMTYKIVQHRAYHHGTMLISSSLAELGKCLKSSSPNMKTKGIPSHRSPVTTLNHYLPPGSQPLHHEHFVSAITKEFAKVYSDNGLRQMETREVSSDLVKVENVWKGVEELKSWEWQYGQTPEFSNEIQGEFSFGSISASLTTRHALITSMTFHLSPPLHYSTEEIAEKQEFLDSLALSLVGKRYENLEGAEGAIGDKWDDEHWREVGNEIMTWLRRTM
ncbi:hypothetical protein CI109_100231 [Kwoniella shandongensis]|uniref:Putative lipoate-protein ligase A n=1 Tax=Kwoniella shandongensis TaxID=1734106 RepID=A0A5M6BTP0_9TREE|nr:uncharacterized protein CI109_006234 [Kwoniella shandongensis]KAA5525430.1 hypothetical protein CI109_006234 [Kwoniella shandongensis]